MFKINSIEQIVQHAAFQTASQTQALAGVDCKDAGITWRGVAYHPGFDGLMKRERLDLLALDDKVM